MTSQCFSQKNSKSYKNNFNSITAVEREMEKEKQKEKQRLEEIAFEKDILKRDSLLNITKMYNKNKDKHFEVSESDNSNCSSRSAESNKETKKNEVKRSKFSLVKEGRSESQNTIKVKFSEQNSLSNKVNIKSVGEFGENLNLQHKLTDITNKHIQLNKKFSNYVNTQDSIINTSMIGMNNSMNKNNIPQQPTKSNRKQIEKNTENKDINIEVEGILPDLAGKTAKSGFCHKTKSSFFSTNSNNNLNKDNKSAEMFKPNISKLNKRTNSVEQLRSEPRVIKKPFDLRWDKSPDLSLKNKDDGKDRSVDKCKKSNKNLVSVSKEGQMDGYKTGTNFNRRKLSLDCKDNVNANIETKLPGFTSTKNSFYITGNNESFNKTKGGFSVTSKSSKFLSNNFNLALPTVFSINNFNKLGGLSMAKYLINKQN